MLIGLGAVVGGAGVLSGSGAFSAVQAERGFDVSTAGDSSALLALQALDTPNGNTYASTSGDTISIDITDINLDAITHLHDVFSVTNNGSQPVALYFEEVTDSNSSAIDIGARTDQISEGTEDVENGEGIADNVFGEDAGIVDLSYPSPPGSQDVGYDTIGVELGVGDSIDLGVYVDTSDSNLNDDLNGEGEGVSGTGSENDPNLLDSVVVWAEAAEVGSAAYTAAGG
jgi:hypothetical protein